MGEPWLLHLKKLKIKNLLERGKAAYIAKYEDVNRIKEIKDKGRIRMDYLIQQWILSNRKDLMNSIYDFQYPYLSSEMSLALYYGRQNMIINFLNRGGDPYPLWYTFLDRLTNPKIHGFPKDLIHYYSLYDKINESPESLEKIIRFFLSYSQIRIEKDDNKSILLASKIPQGFIIKILLEKGADPTVHQGQCLINSIAHQSIESFNLLLPLVPVTRDAVVTAITYGQNGILRQILPKYMEKDNFNEEFLYAVKRGFSGVVSSLLLDDRVDDYYKCIFAPLYCNKSGVSKLINDYVLSTSIKKD